MALFIIGLILGLVGLIAGIVGLRTGYLVPILGGFGALILGGVLIFMSTFSPTSDGEAKVLVNSVDRTVVGTIETPGANYHAPWVDSIEFDLFSQELVYAGGNGGEAPSYSGGTVSGREITVSVGGVSGGSTKANIDAAFVYSIDPSSIKDIYKEFRSQERFTKQVIEKTVLSVARQIPSGYTAIEFRGAERGNAEQAIMDMLNDRLGKYGVEFSQVTIQDARYPDTVEAALSAIEEANQKAQQAEADQRTKSVEAETKLVVAEGQAAADIAKAQGEAEANRILTESLTPQVLEQRKIEALLKAAESGSLIIDGSGAGVLLQR